MRMPALDLTHRSVTRRTGAAMECRLMPGQPRERLERWERRGRNVCHTRESWFVQTRPDGTVETVWFAARNEDLHVLDGEIWELTASRAVNPWR